MTKRASHTKKVGRRPLGHATTYIAVPAPVLARWKWKAQRAKLPLGLWILAQIEGPPRPP